MLAYEFQEYGFRLGSVLLLTKWQGPCSWNSPIIDEQPGPPLSHKARGAVDALLRASKNQNHIDMFVPTERYPEYVLTPGVVSQMPLSSIISRVAFVAACSYTLYVMPLLSRLNILPEPLLAPREATDLGACQLEAEAAWRLAVASAKTTLRNLILFAAVDD